MEYNVKQANVIFMEGRHSAAVEIYRELAKGGDSEAAFNYAFCRLFGLGCPIDESEAKSYFFDVVKYDDTSGTRALVIDSEAESELDLESHEYRIKESDDGYIGEVELYWGYWGELSQNPGLSNYLVTYKLKPNESSTYGLAVSSIRISCIVQDESEVLEESKEEQVINEATDAPFYGIWCYASKDQNEAQKVASQLIELGFNAKVYICSEWSNLNQEMWYCVSADSCQTRAEAEIVQQAALDAGYSEAYIKYSGNYIGK
jgi:hypothetical protein